MCEYEAKELDGHHGPILSEIKRFARVLLPEHRGPYQSGKKWLKDRFYWFDSISNEWSGGFSHCIDECMFMRTGAYVIDRVTGKLWDVNEKMLEEDK